MVPTGSTIFQWLILYPSRIITAQIGLSGLIKKKKNEEVKVDLGGVMGMEREEREKVG